MIKAVLFDFFGVLTEGGREGAIRQVFAQAYGADPSVFRFEGMGFKALKGQVSDDVFIDAMNHRHPDGRKVEPADFQIAADKVQACEPMYALAVALRAHGVRTAVLSNVLKVSAENLRVRGLYDGLDPVLLSCEIGAAKPEPEAYRLALERLGCEPQEVLFIDDQQTYIDAARAMGMRTILAQNPEQTVRDTKALVQRENGVVL